jgi:hypothetical protein
MEVRGHRREKEKRMSIRAKLLGGTAAITLVTGVALAAASPAQSATVPNMFVRSCTFTDSNCSTYAQTNPPFRVAYPTSCQTKGYLGAAGGTYTLPAGQHCPNNSRV